jgi:hypothetical protein
VGNRLEVKPDKYFPKGMWEEVGPVTRVRRLVGQAVTGVVAMAFIGYFSASPDYWYLQPGMAMIKLSLSHPGQKKEPCHKRTREELAKLAPNMRAKVVCGRERLPVTVRLSLDGKTVFTKTAEPKGLSDDGPSLFYERLPVEAGRHTYEVQLRDSHRKEGFDYTKRGTVNLEVGQNFVITFQTELGGFKVY